jgi:hypothetical protein
LNGAAGEGAPRISAIVRSDCGGLGALSRSFHDYLGFFRTVSLSRHAGERHPRWYSNNRVASGGLTVELLGWLCDGADVLLSFETWYGESAPHIAHSMGIRTALMPMYECCPTRGAGLEHTDLAICPSLVDLQEIENHTPGLAGARRVFLPVPFDARRIEFRRRERAEVFLHSMGHGGIAGRNGTRQVIEAWRNVRSGARLLIRHQAPLPIALPPDDRIRAVERGRSPNERDDYWDLWREGDVFLHPHRWDGLSLPIQEALCAGMPVMTTRYWPFCDVRSAGWLPPSSQRMAVPVTATTRQRICREITAYETTPQEIAAAVDAWYGADLRQASEESRAYAERHSWERLLPAYRRMFAELATSKA